MSASLPARAADAMSNPLAALDALVAAQAPGGAFPSHVSVDAHHHVDENAFVTALILDELACLPAGTADRAIARGLDFLESCASLTCAGAFHFYPPGRMPSWLGADLPADADDTALALMLLARFGRLGTAEAFDTLDRVLHPWRLHYRPEYADPWVAQGACRTWLDRRAAPNPVDACVNANVATALTALGRADHDACRAARDTALDAIAFVAENPAHRGRLTAFYPDLWELVHALRRGARRGVAGFAQAAARLAGMLAPHAGAYATVCSSTDRRWRWTAPLLQTARALTRDTP
ncbi:MULTISPECIES: hypothetical protein [Burkholderia]|uniref:Uncharacterized protein n=1 Tax=Burkholderia paludis TaxID=1506587 RepID=A0A6J5DCY7_9BURK|nr:MULTISPECIES: hypothetical protein [Burkholderia]CAB3750666.1 hypothetical protein LMG30113_01262 [Burkholderia paludis]VWB11012.1 hypothetical protein BPA30113_00215 [Burkholderia paludis]